MHNQAFYYTLFRTEVEVERLDGGGRFQPEAKCGRLASAWKPGRSQMLLMGRLFLHAVNCFSFPLYVHHSRGWRVCFPLSQAKEAMRCI